MSCSKVLTTESVNQRIVQIKYAVRGLIPTTADKISREYRERGEDAGIVYCNIGNPHALGQKPNTFFHKVLALVEDSDLRNDPPRYFLSDQVERAKTLHRWFKGAPGAYTASPGVLEIRQEVGSFIEARDGHPCSADSVFLTDGASPAIKYILNLIIRADKSVKDGILTPIPQYPLYSASITQFGGQLVGYFLNESEDWALSMSQLEEAYETAEREGFPIRALILINPGNPTGQCLSEANLLSVLEFCYERHLVVLSDEVYQTNVYHADKRFFSARKVLLDNPHLEGLELVSFHSISKGVIGECGLRGGYFQTEGISEDVMAVIRKMVSVGLCPNTRGQMLVSLMVNPPREGDPSFPLYREETTAIFKSLARRAERLSNALNELEGMSARHIQGALYAFPSLDLPRAAIVEAHRRGLHPDEIYCLELLESEHVCVVPGSGFGGDDHMRVTILPPEHRFDDLIERIRRHHERFMAKYNAIPVAAEDLAPGEGRVAVHPMEEPLPDDDDDAELGEDEEVM
eukprot:gnl/Trimastix_PCT/444.p1 GENE.gnl/Trimastix_PCT/444~~gnl/Trimastix_PCT/444.p1  ORF type:complete len:518 (-),score=188.79 gnl/Trimastix_PCT/444:266-1819(-)